ncbi:hypothetical protein BDW62DRAFT_205886 [Aspergillus aurantiobrunneus]
MSFPIMLLLYTLLLSLFPLIACWQVFPDSTVGEYNDKCADALATNITSCIPAVGALNSNNFYSQRGLDIICTSECGEEQKKYEQTVTDGCRGVSYTNSWGTEYPISEIASTVAPSVPADLPEE